MKHTVCNKFVRICWNTKDWQFPTGEARHLESGNTYSVTRGFGHEEWLFRYDWLLPSYDHTDTSMYRYGFVQPIKKFVDTYADNEFSILLWTIGPDKRRYIVGKINSVYVPTAMERTWAERRYVELGWLHEMREDLVRTGLKPESLDRSEVNIRFRQRDVEIFDPWIDVTDSRLTIATASRYHPYDYGVADLEFLLSKEPATIAVDPRRSEHTRTRKAVDPTSFDPRHVQIQNRLFETLRNEHGNDVVSYENDYVDLKIETKDRVTFIEIKTDLKVRRCIRHALGQILEYSCYPFHSRATELLVVGEGSPTADDKAYLEHLRRRYKLPLYYAQFFWDTNSLGERH